MASNRPDDSPVDPRELGPRPPGWVSPPKRSAASNPEPGGGQRLRKFEAPSTLDAKFGVTYQTEDRIDGLVATEDVRALLDAFGLQDRTEVVFPFQHIKRRQGEIWRMRIEPASYHSIDGAPHMLHHWVFMQDTNERVEQAQ